MESGGGGDADADFDAPSSKALARKEIVAYGIGHMLNDLTAACWFTYLLIYLTDVGLTPREAALVMLCGQVSDGLATVAAGYMIDLFGGFKIWHGGGSLLVSISFSSVFGGCSVCVITGNKTLLVETLGYSVFAAIFNIGWAATQVSHMSLVNCITANPTSRVALNSCRNAFTMVANLLLYGIAFLVFTFKSNDNVERQYRWIASANVAIGGFFVLIFLLSVKEPRLQHHFQPKLYTKISFVSWFRKILYYQVALVYTLTRLTTNVSQALLAFYLIDDLYMVESSKAVVPAVIYMSSFFTSIWLQECHWTSFRLKAAFTTGASLWLFCGVGFFYLSSSFQLYIYPLALVVGTGNALMLVTATSMEGLLVGHSLSGCAFVYGSLSLCDKLACGFALYAIEALHGTETPAFCLLNGRCSVSLVRRVLALVPGGCAVAAAVIALTAKFERRGENDPLREELLLPQAQSSSSSTTTTSEIIEIPSPGRDPEAPLWTKMAHTMVGRWGSLREPKAPWLDTP
ncbi:major facilitator superfamily domain-containing protein 12 [Selaginella moellendorffii]|uniref:major facilitator superfamily domain-containing protein 12 n=1 Tax=Selaginella moellendorffii TaxID=88036 RepID=UPI000D1C7211|nr:major facilitator superfamily domain-containing protein 12 [Selaginella moellendorffii]|eukprot:XP_024525694.1 major facilitator superfamily domain-containing protein 12 [Selaginella moellendorffii]